MALDGSALATAANQVEAVFDRYAVTSFLDAIGVDAEKLLTDDVLGLKLFMQGLPSRQDTNTRS